MQKHSLKTTKTARYFTSGDSSSESVWIIFHGYGMTGDKMINKLALFTNHFMIAPEGLSRFYWKGFDGPVVASWMTKEDRDDEIADQKIFLNTLVESLQLEDKEVNVLGFSQGVSTLIRWIPNCRVKLKKIVLWAGDLPSDVNYLESPFNSLHFDYVVGNADEFIKMELVEQRVTKLKEMGLNLNLHTFEGGHDLHDETLKHFFSYK